MGGGTATGHQGVLCPREYSSCTMAYRSPTKATSPLSSEQSSARRLSTDGVLSDGGEVRAAAERQRRDPSCCALRAASRCASRGVTTTQQEPQGFRLRADRFPSHFPAALPQRRSEQENFKTFTACRSEASEALRPSEWTLAAPSLAAAARGEDLRVMNVQVVRVW